MKIAVVCEHTGQSALELIAKARSIAPNATITALCEGESECKPFCGSCGADAIAVLSWDEDDNLQAKKIAKALNQLDPDAALFPATVRGRFLSAWAAAELNTGLTADCTELSMTEDGFLKQTRPAFGGNLTAEIFCKRHRPQLASVRPGVFPVVQNKNESKVIPETGLVLPELPSLLKRVGFVPNKGGISLQNARIIVAGGKGIGSAKGFDKLYRLAELLGGAVGATRSAVDAGWITYEHQIGQTGIVVHPELYFTFGISGMIQHIVGMNASKTVISVNTDRNAPIFRCADFGIVADWEETIDQIVEEVSQGL